MRLKIHTLAGWYGAVALITGYILISTGALDARGIPYQLMVLTGCTGIVVEALHKKDLPPVVLNLVSVLVALVTIVTLLR